MFYCTQIMKLLTISLFILVTAAAPKSSRKKGVFYPDNDTVFPENYLRYCVTSTKDPNRPTTESISGSQIEAKLRRNLGILLPTGEDNPIQTGLLLYGHDDRGHSNIWITFEFQVYHPTGGVIVHYMKAITDLVSRSQLCIWLILNV